MVYTSDAAQAAPGITPGTTPGTTQEIETMSGQTGLRPAPRISYDAPFKRINGPDEYQQPMCAFHKQEDADAYGRLFAAAPALLAALQTIHAGNTLSGEFTHADVIQEHYRIARAAIAQATTGTQEPARPTAVSETWPRILEALRAANVPDLVDHGHNAVILQGSDLRALIRLVETQVTTR